MQLLNHDGESRVVVAVLTAPRICSGEGVEAASVGLASLSRAHTACNSLRRRGRGLYLRHLISLSICSTWLLKRRTSFQVPVPRVKALTGDYCIAIRLLPTPAQQREALLQLCPYIIFLIC
jgi:hypothetical protein